MASNNKRNGWRVRIVSLPMSTTREQLAEQGKVDISRLFIAKEQQQPTKYAWVNDFIGEHDAEEFARRHPQYQCKVFRPDDEKSAEQHQSATIAKQKSSTINEGLSPSKPLSIRAQASPFVRFIISSYYISAEKLTPCLCHCIRR